MQAWGLTDPGCVRTQNQDNFAIKPFGTNSCLCVVCDGMGGAKSGNIASALAMDIFVQAVERIRFPGMTTQEMEQMLRIAIKQANDTVFDQAQQFADFAGMGTTLVAAYLEENNCVVVNVGDSRGYFLNWGEVRRITTDHSLVQLMMLRGELTPEQARTYPGKNLITRAIGTEPSVECDIFHLEVGKGDYLLLCSDGLSNLVDEQEILFEVIHGVHKQQCCQRLLGIAKERGAPDNVTSILVQIT